MLQATPKGPLLFGVKEKTEKRKLGLVLARQKYKKSTPRLVSTATSTEKKNGMWPPATGAETGHRNAPTKRLETPEQHQRKPLRYTSWRHDTAVAEEYWVD